jgi:hypothetical protein
MSEASQSGNVGYSLFAFLHFVLSAYAFYLSWNNNFDKPGVDRFLRACAAYIFATIYLVLHFLLWRPEYLAKIAYQPAFIAKQQRALVNKYAQLK